jgi:hypothetical protein
MRDTRIRASKRDETARTAPEWPSARPWPGRRQGIPRQPPPALPPRPSLKRQAGGPTWPRKIDRRPELPQASCGPAHESVELVRAADGDHPAKRAELNRADAC